jgi:hypothetical protein
LLLWTREIRTQIVNHQRLYFVNEAMQELQKAAENKPKSGLTPSFSSVGVLMPGRKPLAKGKKRTARPMVSKAKTG